MKPEIKKPTVILLFFLFLALPQLCPAAWIESGISGTGGFIAHWIVGSNPYDSATIGVKVDRVYIDLPDYSIVFTSGQNQYVFEYTPTSGDNMPENAMVILSALMQALQIGATVNAYLTGVDSANQHIFKFDRLMVVGRKAS